MTTGTLSVGIQNSLERLKFGAENGSGYAAWKVGNWFFEGKTGAVDTAAAFDWYLLGIKLGSVLCLRTAAKMVLNGLVTGVDLAVANDWLAQAAAGGDQYAMYELGYSLMLGRGTLRNPELALVQYRKAALLGNLDAKLALAAFEATGFAPNLSRGEILAGIYNVIEKGDQTGSLHYALAMLRFQDVMRLENGLASMMSDLAVAAEKGHALASYELGKLYLREDLGTKNTERAYICFSHAATRDYAPAMYELANMIFAGTALIQDKDAAVQWLKLAWDRGVPGAGYGLYRLSEDGVINERKGTGYLVQSAFGGYGDAIDHLAEYLYTLIDDVDLKGRTPERVFEMAAINGFSNVGYYAAWFYEAQDKGADSLNMRLSWLECGRDDSSGFCTYMLARELFDAAADTRAVSEATAVLYDAADRGSKEAQGLLGYKLLESDQIIGNKPEAAKYLARAAEAGDRASMHNYGLMLVQGDGITLDIRLGNDLLSQAEKLRAEERYDDDTVSMKKSRRETLKKVQEKRGPAKVLEFRKTGNI